MNRTEYILRQLAKTNKKNYENYVVTRIWNLLNNLNIKIVKQQHVTRPSGRALTDLHFPQINLHIEIDEGQHFENGKKVSADLVREADIISATGHKLETIKVCENRYDIDISDINKRIDDVVEIIKSEFKKKIRQRGILLPNIILKHILIKGRCQQMRTLLLEQLLTPAIVLETIIKVSRSATLNTHMRIDTYSFLSYMQMVIGIIIFLMMKMS